MTEFNFCNAVFSSAASGGNHIRPRTGEMFTLVIIEADDYFSDVLDPDEYDVTLIKCDTFNDIITFFNDDGIIGVFDTEDGTRLILDHLRVVESTKPVVEVENVVARYVPAPLDDEEVVHHGG